MHCGETAELVLVHAAVYQVPAGSRHAPVRMARNVEYTDLPSICNSALVQQEERRTDSSENLLPE